MKKKALTNEEMIASAKMRLESAIAYAKKYCKTTHEPIKIVEVKKTIDDPCSLYNPYTMNNEISEEWHKVDVHNHVEFERLLGTFNKDTDVEKEADKIRKILAM